MKLYVCESEMWEMESVEGEWIEIEVGDKERLHVVEMGRHVSDEACWVAHVA